MPAPLANWNPARDAWETSHSHIDLFSGLSAVWSETFPSWGMWAGGVAYELPTSAHLTDGSASSSSPGLLPTPNVGDAKQARSMEHHLEREAALKAKNPKLGGLHLPLPTVVESLALLSTPVASDTANAPGPEKIAERSEHSRGVKLSEHLLRTPTAQLAVNGGSQHPDKRKAGGHGPTLADEVEHLLPTPVRSDGERVSLTYDRGNPTLAGALLLPTPTATPYGNNQSPSPGAAVRPSLDQLAPMLLPTPSVADGMGGHLTRSGSRSEELLLPGVAKSLAEGPLLPTPRATDGTKGGPNQRGTTNPRHEAS